MECRWNYPVSIVNPTQIFYFQLFLKFWCQIILQTVLPQCFHFIYIWQKTFPLGVRFIKVFSSKSVHLKEFYLPARKLFHFHHFNKNSQICNTTTFYINNSGPRNIYAHWECYLLIAKFKIYLPLCRRIWHCLL